MSAAEQAQDGLNRLALGALTAQGADHSSWELWAATGTNARVVLRGSSEHPYERLLGYRAPNDADAVVLVASGRQVPLAPSPQLADMAGPAGWPHRYSFAANRHGVVAFAERQNGVDPVLFHGGDALIDGALLRTLGAHVRPPDAPVGVLAARSWAARVLERVRDGGRFDLDTVLDLDPLGALAALAAERDGLDEATISQMVSLPGSDVDWASDELVALAATVTYDQVVTVAPATDDPSLAEWMGAGLQARVLISSLPATEALIVSAAAVEPTAADMDLIGRWGAMLVHRQWWEGPTPPPVA